MKIALCGLWHLGEVFSTCLAELGNNVTAIDEDEVLINNLTNGKLPIEEPKISSLIKKNIKRGTLKFSSNFSDIRKCDVFWIAIDTPVNNKDEADTTAIFELILKALPYLKKGVLINISSQLPAGSSEKIISLIKKHKPGFSFGYAYIPENLRLGEAVKSFMNTKRIVIGTDNPVYKTKLTAIFKKFEKYIIFMNIISAEIVKHATNSFLGTSLSFIYDISDISEALGGDISLISQALKADERIGESAYLDSSAGFSGGTLARDLQYLMQIGKTKKINLPVISSVLQKNLNRRTIIYQKLKSHMKTLKGKRVTLFGLTYKAGTPTLRRSLPLVVAKELAKNGSKISLYDPYADKIELKKELKNIKYDYFEDPVIAVKNSNAIICITPSQEMKFLKFDALSVVMKKPKAFFDARNFFKNEELSIKKSGLYYIGVGR